MFNVLIYFLGNRTLFVTGWVKNGVKEQPKGRRRPRRSDGGRKEIKSTALSVSYEVTSEGNFFLPSWN